MKSVFWHLFTIPLLREKNNMSGYPVKVSIITISYNQEKYIEQALESFVNQKTNFPFEIIVADDGSSDQTAAIIGKYEKKYPQLFKNILRKKNIGAIANFNDAIKHAKGQFIALCEGDDFWTDNNKLQLQVDFMESHPDYAICFHPVRIFFEGGQTEESIYPSEINQFTLEQLLKRNYIQTNSIMYRAQDNYDVLASNVMPYDWYLHLYHAQFGKIGFINKVMAAYRRHPGGMWWQTAQSGDIDKIWKKYGVDHINMYIELLKMYGDTTQYRGIIDNHIAGTINALNRIDNKNKIKLMNTYAESFNNLNNALLLSLSRTVYESQMSIESLNQKLAISDDRFAKEKIQLEREKSEIQQELIRIKNTKSYKLGHLLTSPYRKLRKIIKGLVKK